MLCADDRQRHRIPGIYALVIRAPSPPLLVLYLSQYSSLGVPGVGSATFEGSTVLIIMLEGVGMVHGEEDALAWRIQIS